MNLNIIQDVVRFRSKNFIFEVFSPAIYLKYVQININSERIQQPIKKTKNDAPTWVCGDDEDGDEHRGCEETGTRVSK